MRISTKNNPSLLFAPFVAILVTALLLSACSDGENHENKNVDVPSASVAVPSGAVDASPVVSVSSVATADEAGLSSANVVYSADEQPLPLDFFKPEFEASDPAAPLEVSVLASLGEGGVFVLPVMSVPMRRDQFSKGSTSREQALDRYSIAQLTALPESDERVESMIAEEIDREVERRGQLLVAQTTKMSSLPESWVDSDGVRYEISGAAARDDGVIGGALGFELKKPPSEKNQQVLNKIVLNRIEGFPSKRTVPDNEWKQWKELTDELSNWSKAQLGSCQNQPDCKKAVDWLSSTQNIIGNAYEYTLGNGQKLRYIQAGSKASKPVLEKRVERTPALQGDELNVGLWILANADGTVQVLHSNDWFYSGMTSIALEDHFCDSQCEARWTAAPGVVTWQGQTFVIGAYSGGTVYGYVIFEVLPNKLQYVERFAWGS